MDWASASPAGPTWKDLLEAFLRAQTSPATARAYRRGVECFHDAASAAPTDTTMRDVLTWRDEMRSAGRSPATIRARLASVSSWFAFLRRQPTPDGRRLVADNPAEDVPAGRVEAYGRAAALDIGDFRRVAGAAGPRLRAWLLVHVLTGRRRAEIARWRTDDLEQRGSTWWYRYRGKGRSQSRWRELPAAAAAALFGWRPDLCAGAARPGESVWGVSEATLVRDFKLVAKAAGVDPRRSHVHALRHLAAKLRRQAGADVREIQEFLDHASPATTAIYLHALEETRDTLADSVARQLLE